MIGLRTRILVALALTATPAAAQKSAIQSADYGKWETPGEPVLSPDGRWLAWPIRRVDESVEVRVRPLDRDTTIVLKDATTPSFTANSRWLVYTITVPPPEREKLEQQKKPVHNRLGILDLRSLRTEEIPRVASHSLSHDGRFVAMRGYPPEGSNTDAIDLIVRDLATDTSTPFGNVTSFAWSEAAPLLAITVRTESGTGNGVQLFDASTGVVRVLDSTPAKYRGLAWREDAADLVVLRTRMDSAFRDTTHVVLAWRNAGSASPRALEYDPAKDPSFPPATRIAESRAPQWAKDGSRIYIGLRPREALPPKDTTRADSTRADSIKPSDVQIWHSRDFRIFPMQRAQERQDLNRTKLAVWNLETNRLVIAGSDLMETATPLRGDRFITETDVKPYRTDAMFGRNRNDIHLIDASTGERRKVIERVRYFMGGSATGRYLLYFEGEDFWTYDTQTGERTNITSGLKTEFANREYDYPVDQYPSFGIAGWTEGDRAVWLYDRYDIWSVAPDGSGGRRLTDGARDSTVHRLVQLDDDEEAIDPSKPRYLSLHGSWSKKSGYALLRPGRAPERLVFEDRFVSRLTRADSADVFVFSKEDYDDSPDFFVAGPRLSDARQVSNTNPFQTHYAWGRTEIIEYTSESGRRLQGSLTYPADYQPGRKYPMIVYQYERLSDGVHRYVVPSQRSYYNVTVFSSQGYFVLQPDIVYRPRDPGRSAVEAIVPAVRAVIARGLVDSTRVGLVGHSWGGYQATYVPTQTNIFAASVAGAPITNYLSFMGAVHWNGGFPETSHWETGQARMDVPYWEDFEAHVRNSPAAFIDRLQTPMLMMFGDADGTVDWHQGVEFYNFARRAGHQNFILLVYPGEDHGLRRKENQIDYQRRILEWFGHWLKGEPAPKWMKQGVTFLERKAILDGRGQD